MVILVTVCTPFVFHRNCDTHFVAEFTGKLYMTACQRKTGFAVIKLAQAFYRFKGFLHMTLRASLSKLIFVRILVTIDTVTVLESCKLLIIFAISLTPGMALLTGYLSVSGFELVFCVVMIEP